MKPRIIVKQNKYTTVLRTPTAKYSFDYVVLGNQAVNKYGIKQAFLNSLQAAKDGGYKYTAQSLTRMAEYMGVQA